MQNRFVAIGECMVEMAPRPDGAYAMGFAGDTFNTAFYARQCFGADWQVGYLSAVGTDAVSDQMIGFMQGAGVDTAAVARVPGRNVGLYMISLAGAERSFAYWRSASAARMLAEDPSALDDALGGAGVIYLSGITLAILEAAARARLLAALTRAQATGAIVAFDPNLRPGLWDSVAQMCAAVTEAAALADIILPSFDDEARFFGDADPEATAARYGAAGVVVVKDGPGQVVCVTRPDARPVLAALMGAPGTWHHAPPGVEAVVDTTAAGDSFNAGFLSVLMQGKGVVPAMQAGAAVAGQVIGARGALVPIRIG